MILVAGGTGRLGRLVVDQMLRAGAPVRVLARGRTENGDLPNGVECIVGDIRDRSDVRRAVDDVDVVVSAVQGFVGKGRVTPQSVDRDGNINLIDAAADRGAHVVLVSTLGAAIDSPMDLFRAKWAAEEHLRVSGAPWTIVRAAAFIETWAEMLQRAPVLGRGENPINFVSVRDVAFAVDEAINDPKLRGAIVEVAGPDDLTMNELVARVHARTGRPRHARHVPRAVLRLAAPFSRLPRAALVMDTTDLTRATITDSAWPGAATDAATALTTL